MKKGLIAVLVFAWSLMPSSPCAVSSMVCWRDSTGASFLELVRFRDPAAPRLDVHWEPSPRDVVAEMLSMAEVRPDDLVFDLGCGDGRIVIEAVRSKGARGVGIDLDPQRIKESVENAVRAGVQHAASFLNEDLFSADIHEATVVTLFLFPDVNLRLRPKLLKELKPGTRVVSYCHNMEGWVPDRSAKIRTNYLHYWVVPDNISGRWVGTLDDRGRQVALRLNLEQEFQQVSGYVQVSGSVMTVEGGHMRGRDFSGIARGRWERNGSFVYLDASVQGDMIVGTIRSHDSPGTGATLTASREPGTKVEIAR